MSGVPVEAALTRLARVEGLAEAAMEDARCVSVSCAEWESEPQRVEVSVSQTLS